jgi:hydrogenase maturation factor
LETTTIVHVGFAIGKIDEESAQKTLQTFHELGLLEEGIGSRVSQWRIAGE